MYCSLSSYLCSWFPGCDSSFQRMLICPILQVNSILRYVAESQKIVRAAAHSFALTTLTFDWLDSRTLRICAPRRHGSLRLTSTAPRAALTTTSSLQSRMRHRFTSRLIMSRILALRCIELFYFHHAMLLNNCVITTMDHRVLQREARAVRSDGHTPGCQGRTQAQHPAPPCRTVGQNPRRSTTHSLNSHIT